MKDGRKWFNANKKYYYINLTKKCVNCGSTTDLMLHHIVPIIKGGTNKLSNVVFLCGKCHSKIHNLNLVDKSNLTKEGVKRAREKGKQIGRAVGTKIETDKAKKCKKQILKYSKKFGGTLNNKECIAMLGIAKATFYKYVEELQNNN